MVGAAGRPRDTRFKRPPTLPSLPSSGPPYALFRNGTGAPPASPGPWQAADRSQCLAHNTGAQLFAELTPKTTPGCPAFTPREKSKTALAKYSGRSPPNQKGQGLEVTTPVQP